MTVFTDKCKRYVPRLMIDLNISRIQACGIMGNIGAETGGFKHLQEINPAVKGSRGGYGWMQWTGPRRKTYEAWCKNKGLIPAADESNYLFLVHETKTDEVHSLMQLRKTTTVEAATETFMAQNLRPGVKHLEARIKYGQQAEVETRVPVAETATTATIGGGAVIAMTQTDPVNWPYIIIGAVAVALVGWWIVKKYRENEEREKQAQVEAIAKITTKGKKNGKET